MDKVDYIFDEDKLIDELKEYVDSTYFQHYTNQGKGGIQITEFIMSHLQTPDFLRGNVLKYVARYGVKEGYNRKDLLKAMHYLLLLLCYHDRKFSKEEITYSSNVVFANSVSSQNVYVRMEGGLIGQEQNGTVRIVGYGELDDKNRLVPGTFRYSGDSR